MVVFVDTSAFLALIEPADEQHAAAVRLWARLHAEERVTTSYVVVETIALLQRRYGFAAVDAFRSFERLVEVIWVDRALHDAGVAIWDAQRRRQLSLVDCVSFAAITQSRADAAFAFDLHFPDQGFSLLA